VTGLAIPKSAATCVLPLVTLPNSAAAIRRIIAADELLSE
jgi:hypothetical protein